MHDGECMTDTSYAGARYEVADMQARGPEAIDRAFENQVAYCRDNDAPLTASICHALRGLLPQDAGGGPVMVRVRNWEGPALADALPLRVAGGLHAACLSGRAPYLTAVYEQGVDPARPVKRALEEHHTFLLPWLDGPPQTNEAGRSWAFIAAMAWLAKAGLPPRLKLFELGSSAGINLMLDRYRFELGDFDYGPADSPMRIAPEWRGEALDGAPFAIASTEGCDVAPVDLTDSEQALRLAAYIWPEFEQRFARIKAAVAMARQKPPKVVRMTAAEFVDEVLARPAKEGTTRIVMHSVVWQYLSSEEQRRITSAIETAGAKASGAAPLAWVQLEANRDSHRHELSLRYWPGGAEIRWLGTAHPHGAWVEWSA